MSWITLSLIYPLIFTGISFFDKFIISQNDSYEWGLPSFTMTINFIIAVLIFTFFNVQSPIISDIGLLLIVGILTQFGTALYFQAMRKSNASTVLIQLQIQHILIYFLAYLFLGEKIIFSQSIGFILMIIASIKLSQKKTVNTKFTFGDGFKELMIANVFFAFAAVLFKLVAGKYNFVTSVGIEAIGIGIGGLILHFSIPKIRHSFNQIWNNNKKIKYLIFLTESIYTVGKVISLLAFTLGPIALVSVLSSVQVFYGLILGLALTKIFPKIYNESLDKFRIRQKFSWSIIMFTGIWFLQQGQ